MDFLSNLDLLSVGVTVAAIAVLGFSVYFEDRKNITNQSFFYFALVTMLWSAANYFHHNVSTPHVGFLLLKFVVFLGVWHAFTFFQLAYVFPKERIKFHWVHGVLFLSAAVVSVLNLSPLVFKGILEVSETGRLLRVENGPLVPVFGVLITVLIVSGLVLLIKRTIKADTSLRPRFASVMAGTLITFALIFVFNFLLPAFFDNTVFIPLGALFIFPFIAFTAYAIIRHRLFNIKVLATSILTFVLSVVTFIEVIFSREPSQVIFRSGIFVLVLVFGIYLIKSVLKEVEQRQKIEVLAKDLEEANKQQQGLIRFITHQVKGFLTKSKYIFASMKQGDFGVMPEESKAAIEEGLSSDEKGVQTVQEILNAANIRKGTVQYDMKSFDLSKLVADIVTNVSSTAKEKGLELKSVIDNEVNVTGDQIQLREVVKNLVDNAVHYTKQGSVMVSVLKKNRKALVSVKDTGKGLTEDAKKVLFTEGGRGQDSVKYNTDSTGYGLFIVKGIVSAHKGRVWAESEGEGKGSTFFVELPL